MPKAKKHPELAGFTIKEVRREAGVTKQTVSNWLRGGGKVKSTQIIAAIERLKAQRIAALEAERARIEQALQQVTSENLV